MTSRFFWKLYAGYIAVVLLTALVSGLAISYQVTHIAEDEIRTQLERETALLLPFCVPYLDSRESGVLDHLPLVSRDKSARYTVIDAGGNVLADSWENPEHMDNHGARPEILEAKGAGLGNSKRFSHTVSMDMSYVARRVSRDGELLGYVRAARPLVALQNRFALLRARVFQAAALAALLGLVPSLFLARRIVNPLSELRAAARRLAQGDYETPMRRVGSTQELAQLAAHVETMRQELRQRVEAITQDRNKLAAVLSSMVEGVVAVDADDCILHINDAAGTIFRCDPRKALGKRIWELPHTREVGEVLEKCIESGNAILREIRLVDLRRELIIEVAASPLRDGGGNIIGAAGVLHDITRVRRLEKIRRDFVSNASHELSTPITGILGSVDTLLEDPQMSEANRLNFLERIHGSANRLVELSRDLNALSRLEDHERGDPGLTDFAQIIKDSVSALEPAAMAKGLSLETHLPQELLTVKAWREDLRLVVDNLVNNAIKYTHEGGIHVRLMRAGANGVLEVEDTGIGIEPVHAERIFERFYRVEEARTREEGGSGLGLSIVRNVSRSVGGSVSVNSEPGAGSVFTFTVLLDPS